MEGEPTLQILSYEEFTERDHERPGIIAPRYNNFKLFFEDDPIRTKKPYFQQLLKEHHELVSKIIRQFQELEQMFDFNDSRREAIKDIEPDMYEAYKLMRSYGAEDEELFR